MAHALPRAGNVILVAEEDADTTRLLRRVLRSADAKIVATRSGARALTIAAGNPVDLVILGVKLPDISGTTLLRRLRAINADVPVLIATSHGSADTVREAMELGAVDSVSRNRSLRARFSRPCRRRSRRGSGCAPAPTTRT